MLKNRNNTCGIEGKWMDWTASMIGLGTPCKCASSILIPTFWASSNLSGPTDTDHADRSWNQLYSLGTSPKSLPASCESSANQAEEARQLRNNRARAPIPKQFTYHNHMSLIWAEKVRQVEFNVR
jgi:hypothetical protein